MNIHYGMLSAAIPITPIAYNYHGTAKRSTSSCREQLQR